MGYEEFVEDTHEVLDKAFAKRYKEQVIDGLAVMTDEQMAKDKNIVDLVNVIMDEAIQFKTTDIQISVLTKDVYVRHRVDSKMRVYRKIDPLALPAILCRIKHISNLDKNTKREPQDGRFTHLYQEEGYDVRVSTLPTNKGENISLRVLYSNELSLNLEDLHMRDHVLKKYRRALGSREGLILLTGPTGSGKTTTLFTSIGEMKERYEETKNIMTIEDPIEYAVDGVVQSQVDLLRGYDFSHGLRSILRQNPDIILVGEIRDRLTAETAVRASNTGHLVFSTLHANDAVSTSLVLKQLGVEPYQISNSLKMVLNQRLAGRMCPHCRKKRRLEEDERARFPRLLVSYEANGCEKCDWTGRKGLVLLMEMVEVDEVFRDMIERDLTAKEMKKALAGSSGYYGLEDDLVYHLNKGNISMSDVEHFLY